MKNDKFILSLIENNYNDMKLSLIHILGLDIFVDPRREGPGINRISIDNSLVKYVEVDGEEFLYYKLPKLTVALIKGTAADRKGNISFDEMCIRDSL